MGIGFLSFGGMLTGGDEAPTEVKETVKIESVEPVLEQEKEIVTITKSEN